MEILEPILQAFLDQSPWGIPQSRIHPCLLQGRQLWVKRDDELSFGISGSKLRKFSSLFSYLLKHKVDYVLLHGGAYSNHLPGILQALAEHGISYQIWLKEDQRNRAKKGNFALLHLLAKPESFRWLNSEDWLIKDSLLAKEKERLLEKGHHVFLINEGADQWESIVGAMSLAWDICRNEKMKTEQMNAEFFFRNIYVDAGTGLSAIGLILGLSLMRVHRKIIVVGMADSEEDFLMRYDLYKQRFMEEMNPILNDQYVEVIYLRPSSGRSFGATNRQVFEKIQIMAREHGLLVDPVYGAKLLLTLEDHLAKASTFTATGGNTLWIHSGGALSLTGFWDRILV